MSTRGVVAAGHRLTAQAAEEVLSAGGNAFDAVLAGMCTACAAEPMLCSLGGGGYLLARPAGEPPRAYDFFVHTPRSQPRGEIDFREIVCDFGTVHQAFHIGLGSIATPGVVRGLFEIHRDLGSMPIREIVAPAIAAAKEGVEVCELHAYVFGVVAPIFMASAAARKVYGSPADPSKLINAGEVLRQSELADTLDALAHEGDDLFYRGEIGQTIDRECRARGGCLRLDDLEHYRVERRTPLDTVYRDARVWTNPPPSSGGLLILFALEMLAAVRDLAAIPFGSAAQLKMMAAALELSDQARIEATIENSARVDRDELFDEELLERYRTEVHRRAAAVRGTTSLSVIDERDNVATLSFSNGEGCGEIVPGTGVMLNNMLGEDDLLPPGGTWKPDERMTSMMAPSLVTFRDGRIVATGSGGSKRIRTAILHVLTNLIDYGVPVAEAVERPRIFYEKDHLNVEGGFAVAEVEQLVAGYPEHKVWSERNLFFGGAHTVERRGLSFDGAGDSRRAGVCRIAKGS